VIRKQKYNEDDFLEPGIMLSLYANGAFPMADEDTGIIEWYMPELRTIIPLDNYNYPRSLRKFIEKSGFELRIDTDFLSVVRGCAGREPTWISDKLIEAYLRLHKLGHIHTVETWANNELVGGLYGITYRGAFFGESMFSVVPQASKFALIKLIERLNKKGFAMLDVQYRTEHLAMFGAVEIDIAGYKNLLHESYRRDVLF
jgi:leucyl/phenylalanyl-tRNA--protein transferase